MYTTVIEKIFLLQQKITKSKPKFFKHTTVNKTSHLEPQAHTLYTYVRSGVSDSSVGTGPHSNLRSGEDMQATLVGRNGTQVQ